MSELQKDNLEEIRPEEEQRLREKRETLTPKPKQAQSEKPEPESKPESYPQSEEFQESYEDLRQPDAASKPDESSRSDDMAEAGKQTDLDKLERIKNIATEITPKRLETIIKAYGALEALEDTKRENEHQRKLEETQMKIVMLHAIFRMALAAIIFLSGIGLLVTGFNEIGLLLLGGGGATSYALSYFYGSKKEVSNGKSSNK